MNCVFASFISLIVINAMGEGAESRWRREYPAAAAELEKDQRDFVAKGNLTFRYFNGDIKSVEEFAVAALGEGRMIINDKVNYRPKNADRSQARASRVECRTPRYDFDLKKEPGSGSFLITQFGAAGSVTQVGFDFDWYFFAMNANSYGDKTLLKDPRSASFGLKGVSDVVEKGDPLIRVDYEFEDVTDASLETGSIYLDPARKWVIRKIHAVTRPKAPPGDGKPSFENTFDKEIEYILIDNKYMPKHMESTSNTLNPDVYQHVRLDFNVVTVDHTPESMFRLATYGLPEIPLSPRREVPFFSLANPILWVCAAISVVCLILLNRARRRGR